MAYKTLEAGTTLMSLKGRSTLRRRDNNMVSEWHTQQLFQRSTRGCLEKSIINQPLLQLHRLLTVGEPRTALTTSCCKAACDPQKWLRPAVFILSSADTNNDVCRTSEELSGVVTPSKQRRDNTCITYVLGMSKSPDEHGLGKSRGVQICACQRLAK